MTNNNLKYARVLEAIFGSVWAIMPEKMAQMTAFLEFAATGGRYSAEEVRAAIGPSRVGAESPQPSIAVIPVHGIISQRMDNMADISGPGSVSTTRVSAQLRGALADDSIKAIVFDFDTPGGTVFGVEELVTEIFNARGKKPMIGSINSLAASAGLWIISALDEISIMPGGEVGSLGVFSMHVDASKHVEDEGFDITLIQAEISEFKTEGTQFRPLSEGALAHEQSRVNDYGIMFLNAVARNRGMSAEKVLETFGKGRVFGARHALEIGMVDRIETFDQTIERVGEQIRTGVTTTGTRLAASSRSPFGIQEFGRLSDEFISSVEGQDSATVIKAIKQFSDATEGVIPLLDSDSKERAFQAMADLETVSIGLEGDLNEAQGLILNALDGLSSVGGGSSMPSDKLETITKERDDLKAENARFIAAAGSPPAVTVPEAGDDEAALASITKAHPEIGRLISDLRGHVQALTGEVETGKVNLKIANDSVKAEKDLRIRAGIVALVQEKMAYLPGTEDDKVAVLETLKAHMEPEAFAKAENALKAASGLIQSGGAVTESGHGAANATTSATEEAMTLAKAKITAGESNDVGEALSQVFIDRPDLHQAYIVESQINV